MIPLSPTLKLPFVFKESCNCMCCYNDEPHKSDSPVYVNKNGEVSLLESMYMTRMRWTIKRSHSNILRRIEQIVENNQVMLEQISAFLADEDIRLSGEHYVTVRHIEKINEVISRVLSSEG
jgi:hypothetical protein